MGHYLRTNQIQNMKPQIQISAKNLGALALPSFCPRCFWIRMKCREKLPYQTFPGIFSSIDSYSKRVTTSYFDRHGKVPKWFESLGELGRPIPVPGWSKFQTIDEETNIRLTGVPDEILRHPERGVWIGDYKTARFTETQDELAPMYHVQLNSYAFIAPRIGFRPVYALALLYYEPVTDAPEADREFLIKDDCFFLKFSPKLKPVKLEPDIVQPLLRKVREICDLAEAPAGRTDCHDCSKLETLIRGTRMACSLPAMSQGVLFPALCYRQ
jgi:hypothetical protein